MVCLAPLAKCVSGTLLTTVCSHMNRERKMETNNTSCCWDKFKWIQMTKKQWSNASWNSRILCNTSRHWDSGNTEAKETPNKKDGKSGKFRNSSVPLAVIISTFLYRFRHINRIRRQSPVCLVKSNPSWNYWSSFHQSITKSWTMRSCCFTLRSRFFLMSFCSPNFSFNFRTFAQIVFPLFVFDFLQMYVMLLASSLSSNLTLMRYRAGRLRSWAKFPLRAALSVDFSAVVFALLFSIILHLSRFFCSFDPCVVVLHVISCRRFSFFRLVELVDLVFPYSTRSSYGSVSLTSWTQIWDENTKEDRRTPHKKEQNGLSTSWQLWKWFPYPNQAVAWHRCHCKWTWRHWLSHRLTRWDWSAWHALKNN